MKSYRNIYSLLVLLVLTTCLSCAGEDTSEPTATITLSPSVLKDFLPSGGERDVQVAVSALGFEWRVDNPVEWIEIDRKNSGFTLKVAPNPEEEERSATLAVTGENLNVVELAVRQLSSASELLFQLHPTSLDFEYTGGTEPVSIMGTTGLEYEYEVDIPAEAPWLSISNISSSGFNLRADLNESKGRPRTAEVTVTATELDESRTLWVTQQPQDPFYFERDNYNFLSPGGTVEIRVFSAGLDWSVKPASGQDWASAEKVVRKEDDLTLEYLSVTVRENTGAKAREAVFNVSAPDMEAILFTVTQNSVYDPQDYTGQFRAAGNPMFLITPGNTTWDSDITYSDGRFTVSNFAGTGVPFYMTVSGDDDPVLTVDMREGYYPSGGFYVAIRCGYLELSTGGSQSNTVLKILDVPSMEMVFDQYNGTMYPAVTSAEVSGAQREILYGMMAFVRQWDIDEENPEAEPVMRYEMVGPASDFYKNLRFSRTSAEVMGRALRASPGIVPANLPVYLQPW